MRIPELGSIKKMNSHVVVSAFLSLFLNSFPCFASKDAIKQNTTANAPQLILDQINFDTSIDQLIKKWGLNLRNDTNSYTNLNLDYDEFIVDSRTPLNFLTENLNHHYQDLSIFYDKKSKNIFSYELLVTDPKTIKKIIYTFTQKYGKPLFNKKQSSKGGTIFFDENGNQTSNLIQRLYTWKHQQYSYYLIEKNEKKHTLNIIVINNRSQRFKTWFAYKSLNMIFPQ